MKTVMGGSLVHGGPLGVNQEDFDTARRQALRDLQAPPEPQPRVWVRDVAYTAAYNSTSNVPSGDLDGLELADGSRIWAEVRSFTASAGAAAPVVTLRASQNGARAYIDAGAGVTVAGGSVRWWVMEPNKRVWHLGGVDEQLATGVQRVATTDQLITVGAR